MVSKSKKESVSSVAEEDLPPIGCKYCLNCAAFLGTNIKITHLRRDITSPTPDPKGAGQTPKPLLPQQQPVVSSYVTTIPDALKYLYKLHLHPDLLPCQLNELILCETCGELLTSLYLIHKEFHKLTSGLSFLGKVLKQLTNSKAPVRKIQAEPKIIPAQPEITVKLHPEDVVHNEDLDDEQQMDFDDNNYDEQFNVNQNTEDWSNNMPEEFRNAILSENPSLPKSKISCYICHKAISRYSIRRHLDAHEHEVETKARGFECGICGRTHNSSYCIRVHLRTHLGEHEQDLKLTYSCRYCRKIYLDKEAFEEHRASERRQVRKPKSCEECPKTTGGNSSLGSNILGQQIPLACPRHASVVRLCAICGKSGSYNHEWTHFNKEEREAEKQKLENPLLCSECGACFPFQASLAVHIRNSHGTKKPKREKGKTFKCTKCPKSYTNRRSFTLHRRRHDNPSKNFLCTYCSQVFELHEQLTEHVQRDCQEAAADRPYQCSICQKNFSKRDRLRSHIFKVHKLSAIETRQMVYPELTKEPPPDLYSHLNAKRTRKRPSKYSD